LDQLKKDRKSIWGYGASGRANTIIQYCNIGTSHLDCIIDDAPAKHGFYTPGSHFPIVSRDLLSHKAPDYILVFAWSFISEILGKTKDYSDSGGRFIIPLPQVKIASEKDGHMTEDFPDLSCVS
jgi:methylation protein EvaC